MKVLVSGASGLIGSALVAELNRAGHQIERLARGAAPVSLNGVDAVVHLAGESIAGRWTAAKKREILESRVQSTRLLADLVRPPQIFLCASAIGFYGDRGDEVLTEESAPGSGFLPDVCRQWEAATEPVSARGVRVVNLRFGVVLSERGGALASMLTPFRLGAGGVIGNGRQCWSWVTVDDAVSAIQFALTSEQLRGAVNVVSPNPATNREFTRTLGRVLHRSTLLPLPAFAARWALGEAADALLLASARVQPARLQAAGFEFRHPNLESALKFIVEA